MACFHYDWEQYRLSKDEARKKLKRYWYHANIFLKKYGEKNNLYDNFLKDAPDGAG